ncbi:hypothetical protein mRhiFer1_010304 [Rhinolophus ferrumequinum]|uniref:POM121 transmembrane nucleoporin like 12 n=1 Tax=Rhinolophus ferrumequinum TaxID=59479 RepID=A0A7J7X6K6_RHIFE|nr:hypothetical protein mRhiFer1_010304 [Rhinolophus ferrumequinum]
MGHSLSKFLGRCVSCAKAKLRPPARARHNRRSFRQAHSQPVWDRGQVSHVLPRHRVPTRPLPNISPLWAYTSTHRVKVPDDFWRHFPQRLPPWAFMAGDSPNSLKGQLKMWCWTHSHRRRIQSPVRVRINPSKEIGREFRCPPAPERPDPCAKETVLRALSGCNKGKRKFEEPLWAELPDSKRRRQSPGRGPSAFKLIRRKGVTLTVVPRPGPLTRVLSDEGSSDEGSLNPGLLATFCKLFLSADHSAARKPPAQATVAASAGELGVDRHSPRPEDPPARPQTPEFIVMSY